MKDNPIIEDPTPLPGDNGLEGDGDGERISLENSIPPLDETLIDRARTIKKERDLYQDRLNKLDEKKGEVSKSVYQKIRGDYLVQLNEAIKNFIDISNEVKENLSLIKNRKLEIQNIIKIHQENLEESKVRHQLGEFSKENLKKYVETEQEKIESLEKLMKTALDNIAIYEELIKGETITSHITPDAEPSPFEMIEHPPPDEFEEIVESESVNPNETTDEVSMKIQKPLPEKTDETSIPSLGGEESVPSLSEGDYFTPQPELPQKPQETRATPSPSMPAPHMKQAQFIIKKNGKEVGKQALGELVEIGRSPSNTITLKDAKVSRKHAQIHQAGGKYVLIDLESSNGTYVNDKKVSEHPLQPKDVVRIGPFTLIFTQ